ncbi:hypothetical protein Aple_070470 [Acrocarpospora pleiomorpha]|uniref:HTH luxR-type domain-containing protein n=1 Tax=Acrocarpospora pleiomorpha TaxID=90975 RepID=A0A5M3Y0D7_9ACTN|nr:AAA family ATPase [Acrocarpospora pleiomorpha]GES24148.1 hypothetical protein Aple_070470 [Acrocarpospora pleiomorpha]
MRGRQREWSAVVTLLETADGGATLLLEGQAGMGKTRLLAEAGSAARARGLFVAASAVEELGQLIPMAPLFTAIAESPDLTEGPDLHTRLLEQLRSAMAARTPLLVTLDDLQWADTTTLMALRTLHGQLSALPVTWLLARTVTEGHHDIDSLFDILERHGARRITLPPLPPAATAELAADVLAADPDPDLLALAATTNGNPALLVELLRGLRDENCLDITAGTARLLTAGVPERLQASVRQLLSLLTPEAKHLVETAAVLGRSFQLDEVAELLGSAPALLLPPLEEAITAGVLVSDAETLTFQYEVLWRAVVSGLPPAVRQSLHRNPSHDSDVLTALRRGDLAGAAARAEAAYAALPHDTATALPHDTTAALPHDTTAALPHDTATALPHSTTTAQPHDTTTAQPHGATEARIRSEFLMAQVVEARDGAGPAMALVRHIYADPASARRLLAAEPVAAVWLVRLALAVGQRSFAERVAELAAELGAANPESPAAAHARGLLSSDSTALAHAARNATDPWYRASAAEDLGVLLSRTGERSDALRSLDEALAGYGDCGATRDEARVRRRMRRMGVRHRHWTNGAHPPSGWDSLTATELRVSLLVAQGWTNRQVAEQMFISVHTVAFHLRQVFRKLEIGSRVALARLAAELESDD